MLLPKLLFFFSVLIILDAIPTKTNHLRLIRKDPKGCPSLPFVDHGTYKVLSKRKVRVVCDPPYVYIDPSKPWTQSTVIYCKKGNWSNPDPLCRIPTNNCDPPEPIANGKYIEYASYPRGSTIQYYCNEGYKLVGPTVRTCHNRWLKWTDDSPICKKVEKFLGHDVEVSGLDLFLIFDQSASIRPSDFSRGIKFAQFLVERLNVSNGDIDKEGGTRLSILTFGDNFIEVMTLNDVNVSSTHIAQQKLDGIKCGAVCDGSTNMGAALERAYFLAKHSSREDAKKALFLTTDGVPNDAEPVIEAAAKLKKIDVEIYTIGVGEDVNKELLANIVSTPWHEHVFKLNNLSDFDVMIKVIRDNKPTPSERQ